MRVWQRLGRSCIQEKQLAADTTDWDAMSLAPPLQPGSVKHQDSCNSQTRGSLRRTDWRGSTAKGEWIRHMLVAVSRMGVYEHLGGRTLLTHFTDVSSPML